MEKKPGSELLRQAADYFNRPGFERLFAGLQGKFTSLAHLGGSISLKGLTKEESEALEGFLQINMPENGTVSIPVGRIRKALQNTRYAECRLEDIVPLVLKEPLISKKEAKACKDKERREFFDRISAGYGKTIAGNWLDKARVHDRSFAAWLVRDYNENNAWLEENLPLILTAVNRLPALTGRHLRLPVFAAAVTGNPHYFDEGKRSLTYLLYAIRDVFNGKACDGGGPGRSGPEAGAELLYAGGLLKDDLSNWVLCRGIRGYSAGGEVHRGMEEYCRRGEAQILTLRNLSFLRGAAVDGGKVYVVENPAVFSQLIEQDTNNCACICSGGQLRLAVLILLDLLAESGITIYYSGDFDPEGLSIAQKLVSRYGSRLTLWCYDEELYHKAISSETISERRLKQLAHLRDEKLIALAELLKEYRRPGYQENIMDWVMKISDERIP